MCAGNRTGGSNPLASAMGVIMETINDDYGPILILGAVVIFLLDLLIFGRLAKKP